MDNKQRWKELREWVKKQPWSKIKKESEDARERVRDRLKANK